MRYLNPELADRLAAEYVLGTLHGRARQRFVGLLGAHPLLRRRVRAWELNLNRLAAQTVPVPPPPQTWTQLQQRLFPAPQRPWYQRLAVWRTLSGAGALATIVLAVLLVGTPTAPSAGYLVMLDKAGEQPMWLLGVSPDMERFYVKNLKPMPMPNGKRCLLWLQAEGSQQFYALGVLPDQGEAMLLDIAPPTRQMLPGKLLVTVEDMADPPAAPTSATLVQSDWMPLARL